MHRRRDGLMRIRGGTPCFARCCSNPSHFTALDEGIDQEEQPERCEPEADEIQRGTGGCAILGSSVMPRPVIVCYTPTLVNSQAIAAPMPVPPPVTIATLFDSLIDAPSESTQTQHSCHQRHKGFCGTRETCLGASVLPCRHRPPGSAGGAQPSAWGETGRAGAAARPSASIRPPRTHRGSRASGAAARGRGAPLARGRRRERPEARPPCISAAARPRPRAGGAVRLAPPWYTAPPA
jgi:hypothetical protein